MITFVQKEMMIPEEQGESCLLMNVMRSTCEALLMMKMKLRQKGPMDDGLNLQLLNTVTGLDLEGKKKQS